MDNSSSILQGVRSVKELRVRARNTLLFLLLFRIGTYVVLPGVNATDLTRESKGVLGLLDTFLGGAFSNASVLGLGVMPYISASIIVQLFTIAIPYFRRLQQEGYAGRSTINQITKVLTIGIAFIQAVAYLSTAVPAEAITVDRSFFIVVSMFTLTAGTMFCVWLGGLITDKGIGQGVSMLIMVGIISSLPGALVAEIVTKGTRGLLILVVEFLVLLAIISGVILFTKATRKVHVQYARQMLSHAVYHRQRQYIPLKLNSSGVMPIIFAQALMFLPALVANVWAEKSSIAAVISGIFSDYTTWQYNVTFSILIIFFSFFYTAITINPTQIADDMKRNNGFIPGIKPGKQTASTIDEILSKITLPGALFLSGIAILPMFATMAGVSNALSRFYGGTSLLIIVGVVLDTLQQVEGILLMHRYEGLTHAEQSFGV